MNEHFKENKEKYFKDLDNESLELQSLNPLSAKISKIYEEIELEL